MIANRLPAEPKLAARSLDRDGSDAHSLENPGDVPDSTPDLLLPRTLGSVFDGAFDLYKRHFGTLSLLVALVFIPTQVALHAAGNLWLRPLAAQWRGENPDPGAVILTLLLGFFIGSPVNGIPGFISLLTSFMASGPVAVAVANILFHRPISIGIAYRRALPVFWRLFWTFILLSITFMITFCAVFFALIVTVALIFGGLGALGADVARLGGPELGAVFLVLWLVLPYLIGCLIGTYFFAFAPALVALENGTVVGAATRNSQLIGKRGFWRVYLAITLLPIVTFGLQMAILWSLGSVVDALHWPSWTAFVLSTGVSSLISFFFQPYWMIFITLLYFDCRARREGLDVRYIADTILRHDIAAQQSAPSGDEAQSGEQGRR